MDITTLFRQHKRLLQFSLVNGISRRMNDYLCQGVKDLKVFRDRVTFIGKLYNDPKVEIKFADIESIHIEFIPKKRNIKRIVVTATPSPRSYYRRSPGPDL